MVLEEGRAGGERKLAVFFPGIGYTCDRPLLYYSEKLARGLGYETIRVPYGNFPKNVLGSPEKKKESFRLAMEQARELLKDLDWEGCGRIVLVGKSIGTCVAAALAEEHSIRARRILDTPVPETFAYPAGDRPEDVLVFHGTRDPWAETGAMQERCRELGLSVTLVEGANHSLETGDVARDIRNLAAVMEETAAFLAG